MFHNKAFETEKLYRRVFEEKKSDIDKCAHSTFGAYEREGCLLLTLLVFFLAILDGLVCRIIGLAVLPIHEDMKSYFMS